MDTDNQEINSKTDEENKQLQRKQLQRKQLQRKQLQRKRIQRKPRFRLWRQ